MARKQITDLTPTQIIENIDYLHIKDGGDGVDKQLLFSEFELPTTSIVRQTVESLGDAAFFNIVPITNGGTGGSTQASARTGLGLGSAATRDTGTVNSGDIPDRGQADLRYLRKGQNLADLTNTSAARTALDVPSSAEVSSAYLAKASNLSGLTNQVAARGNLGLSNTATVTSTSVGQSVLTATTTSSVRDLLSLGTTDSVTFSSISANGSALTNLNASSLSTGTVPTARLPSDLLSTADFGNVQQVEGYSYLGRSGIILQWGQVFVGADSTANVIFPKSFTTSCFNVTATASFFYSVNDDCNVTAYNFSTTGCTILLDSPISGTVSYIAIGV